jgi:glycine betaine/proline transport system permease protein
MVTLALVITSVLFCLVIGIPIGILCSRKDLTYTILRPILDIMQTTPPFVYLVPAVMLFSIGNVPGLIATIIFAMPPTIRLTNLGIRQVPSQYTEAATAFGSSPQQILWKVQVPLALPTIMAGLNQTIMLALSMVVIAAIIGAGGLGLEVFQGLNRLDIGQAFVGGLGIVLLAMVLDRITQGLGDKAPGNRAGGDE